MDREYREANLFSENIDRLLAGNDLKTEPSAGDDFVSALKFAQKMTVLRVEPSAQFSAQLKARLLQELREKELSGEAGQGWFGRLFKGQRLWLTTAVCVVLLIVVGGVLWNNGVFKGPGPEYVSPPPVTATSTFSATTTTTMATATATSTATSPVTSVPAPDRYLRADASVDKSVYKPGETVNIEVDLTNVSGQPFTITQYPPIISLMSSDTQQAVYTFKAGQQIQTIPPGEKATFTLSWDQADSKGYPVKSGNYYIELEDLDLQGKAVKLDLKKTVSFDILSEDSGEKY